MNLPINKFQKTVVRLKTIAVLALIAGLLSCLNQQSFNAHNSTTWQQDFNISERKLLPNGSNAYFILEPGFQLILESSVEKLVITVLEDTKLVNGILTRVVEEREWKNGNLIEVSRNFMAIDESTKDVFYFGEEVDMFKDGILDSHSGAWLAGKEGAKAGLLMSGNPKPGMKYYQEIAEGVAMDRAQVIKLDDQLETPLGLFSDCLLTKEGSALNIFELEFKTYAPGIGLIQDEKLLLTSQGFLENGK